MFDAGGVRLCHAVQEALATGIRKRGRSNYRQAFRTAVGRYAADNSRTPAEAALATPRMLTNVNRETRATNGFMLTSPNELSTYG